MESIEESMKQLADALKTLEEELTRTVDANADNRDARVAAGRQARNARLTTQEASSELSGVISDLKDMIKSATPAQ